MSPATPTSNTVRFVDLDTPALLVDLDRMHDNIADIAGYAKERGVGWRPHTKTHKSSQIAQIQMEAGAVGITCAKLGEAEVMASAGLGDILIANEIIGGQKYRRLIELTRKCNLCIAIDSEYGAWSLNTALADAGLQLDVMIEVNCGQNRGGVLPVEEVLQLALEIKQCRQLRLRGIMTHGGHAYNETTREGIERVGEHEGAVMVATAEELQENGVEVQTVSVGSTPTAKYAGDIPGVTEIRPGTNVFHDLTQVDLFACTLEDCALSVLSTVTSHPTAGRVILDAGKKVLTSDPRGRAGTNGGFGFLPEKDAAITRLSEEHGVIESRSEFRIGEKVCIIPNHACVVVNMFDEMHGVRNGKVETVFSIDGRGKSR